MAWLPGWNYRKQITISSTQVDSSLSGFPLCVPLARSDFSGALASGADLRFTASDGETLLDYIWTGWTENQWSGAYVKIPSLGEAADTIIHLYYGNASASDASNAASVLADYVAFAPLRNWTSGQQELAAGAAVVNTSGEAGPGGVGVLLDYTRPPYVIGNDLGDALIGESGATMSCLIRDWSNDGASTNGICGYVGSLNATTTRSGTRIYPSTSAAGFSTRVVNDQANSSGVISLSPNDNLHLAGICHLSGSEIISKVYARGSLTSSESASSTQTGISFGSERAVMIGHTPSYNMCAVMAEFRILKGAASDAWIKFENANLMTAGNQLTFGEEESLPEVEGPYQIAMPDTFQTDIQQAETYIPGIMAGHTHGT